MRRLLCHCLVVDEAEVVRVIRRGARTVDEVGAACEAGSGCGSCRTTISLLIPEVVSRLAESAPEASLQQLGLFSGTDKSEL